MIIQGYAYNYDNGTPLSGQTVNCKKRLPSPATIASTTTDSNGRFTFTFNGCPGIVDCSLSSGLGAIKIFGDVSLPRVGGSVDSDLLQLWNMMYNGYFDDVGSELAVIAGTGMIVRVGTGAMVLQDQILQVHTPLDLAVASNAGPGSRTDTVVARLYLTGDDIYKKEFVVKQNTTTLQQDANIWEERWATLTIPASITQILGSHIADNRGATDIILTNIDASIIGGGSVSNAEFGALDGITGNIQTQFTTHTHGNSTVVAGIDAAKISSGVVSNTEFDRLDGVSSAIQTQLNTAASNLTAHAALPSHTDYYLWTMGPWHMSNTPINTTADGFLVFLNSTTSVVALDRGLRVGISGEIVGISMVANGSTSGGTATAKVNVQGTSVAFNGGACNLNSGGNNNRAASWVAPGNGVPFSSSNSIYPELVTDGSWSPTTLDVVVYLIARIPTPWNQKRQEVAPDAFAVIVGNIS